MQKNTNKASILVLSIILSLILSIIFISISNKINLNLKQNTYINQNIKQEEEIEENLKTISKIFKDIKTEAENINYQNSKEKNEKIKDLFYSLKIFENKSDLKIRTIFDEENFILKKNEKLEIIIPTFEKNNLKIKSYFNKIDYSLSFISTKSEKNLENKEEKWEIENEKNFDFENDEPYKKIIFENKSWEYSKISIISKNFFISNKDKYYKIYKKILDKEVFKEEWFLKIN